MTPTYKEGKSATLVKCECMNRTARYYKMFYIERWRQICTRIAQSLSKAHALLSMPISTRYLCIRLLVLCICLSVLCITCSYYITVHRLKLCVLRINFFKLYFVFMSFLRLLIERMNIIVMTVYPVYRTDRCSRS